jgi:GDP-L-fucose synthase
MQSHINVGTGADVTIREAAELIREVVGYEGRIEFDKSKPDGTPRKLMDSARLAELGWQAKTELDEGLAMTYGHFKVETGALRVGELPEATPAWQAALPSRRKPGEQRV